jgi:class 3 adenylate cyclase/tetratricopeptide (TPR) repeat protein
MALCPQCGEENPDKFRLCGYCGAALQPALPPQEVRKTVSIVFSDLKGSTNLGEALDSESLREVMTRYFDEMSAVLVQHGGTIEKFIGDAIMAVFGLPKLHEDDALRAVRAAAGMQRALARLNVELGQVWGVTLTNRTGVNTGEVVAGDPTTGQRLVTGDAVNTAARLEQAAPANEVLLGGLTYQLVREAVEVEVVEPLELKGKAERVPAFRLVRVRDRGEGWTRRQDAPLVGRETELATLDNAFTAAVESRSIRLVTMLANAGVGKSRLTEEFLRTVGDSGRILRGRCLSYGEVAFWPLAEVVRHAASIREDDSAEVAREKLAAIAGADAQDAVERVASALGIGEREFPLDEIFWGTRKLVETLAAEHPLVLIFDDIHWAAPTFLDLVEYLLDHVADAPVLLLCPARHELLELRPEWAERQGAERFVLAPLTAQDTERIVESLLGGAGVATEARTRIAAAAEGNPLFVEQLLAMLVESGELKAEDGRWVAASDLADLAVPPTIQALLAARLDRLDPEERHVIEPASVIGHVFPQEAVEELVPEPVRPNVPMRLEGLAGKHLVRREEAGLGDGDRFRFDHVMIREAAYGGLLKRARATLHERFVTWADRVNRERGRETEFEEILGYHLEQAYRYLSELGPLEDHGQAIGTDAATRLASAGRRAFSRGDMASAANLLRRAAALLPENDRQRIALLPDLGEALMEVGDFAAAGAALDEAVDGAAALEDETLGAGATLTRLLVQHHVTEDLASWRADVEHATNALIPALEERRSHAELATAWRMVAWIYAPICRWEAAAEAQQRALEHARLAGNTRLEARLSSAYGYSLCDGPTPVREAIARCEEMIARQLGHKQSEAIIRVSLACLLGLDGQFDRAREVYQEARAMLDDLGASVLSASTSFMLARVELLAGNAEAAERDLRTDYDRLAAIGEVFFRTSVGAMLSHALFAQGRIDEAEVLALEAEALAANDDIEVEALCRSVRARILACRGEFVEAERLAREAVELIPPLEAPLMRTEALLDLAEVLLAGDQGGAADVALQEARVLAMRKEMTVPASRVETLLQGLEVREAEPVS